MRIIRYVMAATIAMILLSSLSTALLKPLKTDNDYQVRGLDPLKTDQDKEIHTAAELMESESEPQSEQNPDYPARYEDEPLYDFVMRTEQRLMEKYTALGYDAVPRPAGSMEIYEMLGYINRQAKLAAQMQMEEETIMQQELTDTEFEQWSEYKLALKETNRKYNAEFERAQEEDQQRKDWMLEEDLRVQRITQY